MKFSRCFLIFLASTFLTFQAHSKARDYKYSLGVSSSLRMSLMEYGLSDFEINLGLKNMLFRDLIEKRDKDPSTFFEGLVNGSMLRVGYGVSDNLFINGYFGGAKGVSARFFVKSVGDTGAFYVEPTIMITSENKDIIVEENTIFPDEIVTERVVSLNGALQLGFSYDLSRDFVLSAGFAFFSYDEGLMFMDRIELSYVW